MLAIPGLLRKMWEIRGPFFKEQKHPSVQVTAVLFSQSEVPTGKNAGLGVISKPQVECGSASRCHLAIVPFPFLKDIAWHPDSAWQLEVPF